MKLWPDKFVADWRTALKMWSIRLNILASILVAYVLAAPDVMLSVLNSLPSDVRAVFPPFIGLALFGLVTVVRLWKQEKLDAPKPPTDV